VIMATAEPTAKTDWEVKTLGELSSTFVDGNWVESKDQSADGIRLIQTGNIGCGDFKDRRNKSRFISDETFVRLRCTEVLKGDCLVSRLPEPVGRSCIIPATGEKMITAVDCTIIRFKPEKIFPVFFKYFSQSKEYLLAVDEKCTGATRRRISRKNLGLVTIPVPPLAEQERIVGILDEAFEGIAAATAQAEKNLHNARELFQSVLQSTFSQKGDDWVETTLGEAYDVRDGTHDSPKYQTEGYPLLTSKNLKRNGLNYDKVKFISSDDYHKINERSKVDQGDVLFAMIGTIGNPVVVSHEPNFAIKNMALFKVGAKSSKFLRYYLDSELVISKMAKEAKGTTQRFVGLGYLRKFPISLPSDLAQQAIVEKLDALSEETKRLETIYERKQAALSELKQSLLQKAFAGEL